MINVTSNRYKKIVTSEELETTSLIVLAVQGMGCRNCATRVQNSLIQVKGVYRC